MYLASALHFAAITVLALAIVFVACAALRNAHRRVTSMDDRRMATRTVRPYAIVEAYDAKGEQVAPTLVYSEDQAETAERKYLDLGCAVTVRTPIDMVH